MMNKSPFYIVASFCVFCVALDATPLKRVEALKCIMFQSKLAESAPKYLRKSSAAEISFSRPHTAEFAGAITKSKESPEYMSLFYGDNISVFVRRRLDQEEAIKLLPVNAEPDWPLSCCYGDDPMFLPKIFTVLNMLTGPCDGNFDSFKGSFSFQFTVDVEKNKTELSRYLYWIIQYRSFLRVKIYQHVPEDDPRDQRLYINAREDLCSENDFLSFSFAFFQHLLHRLDQTKHKPEPFVLKADSNLLIFGYIDDAYFSKEFKDSGEYRAEFEKLEERIEESTSSDYDLYGEQKEDLAESKSLGIEAACTEQTMIEAKKASEQENVREVGIKQGAEAERLRTLLGALSKVRKSGVAPADTANKLLDILDLTPDEINLVGLTMDEIESKLKGPLSLVL